MLLLRNLFLYERSCFSITTAELNCRAYIFVALWNLKFKKTQSVAGFFKVSGEKEAACSYFT